MPGSRLLMKMYLCVGNVNLDSAHLKTLGLGPCTLICLETIIVLNTLLKRLLGQPLF